jgi:ribose-phosphate pyrophosphokinase
MSTTEPLIFSTGASSALAAAIAHGAQLGVAPLEERTFEGGEFKLRPLVSVRGRTVFVVQTLAGTADAPTADRILRLLFLLTGLRDAGAVQRIALVPYLAFARKDRRTQTRDPVTTRYLAELLEAAGATMLVGLDVHNPAAFDNAFRIPVMHLSAQPLFAAHLAAQPEEAGDRVVVSPDVGGVKRAQLFRELLQRQSGADVPLAFIEKRRAAGVVSGGTLVGEVRGRRAVVLDDLCATGGTLVRAAAALRAAGAREVTVIVTHAPLAVGLRTLLEAPDIDRVLVTDSVGSPTDLPRDPRLTVLPVAPLFAQVVQRLAAQRSLTPLLERWPPAD